MRSACKWLLESSRSMRFILCLVSAGLWSRRPKAVTVRNAPDSKEWTAAVRAAARFACSVGTELKTFVCNTLSRRIVFFSNLNESFGDIHWMRKHDALLFLCFRSISPLDLWG